MENLFRLMVRNALHIGGLRQLLLIRRGRRREEIEEEKRERLKESVR